MDPGAVLLFTDGTISTFTEHGRRSPPLTIFVRRGRGAKREIPLTDVAKVKPDPYASETTWYKIKTAAYTQGEGPWELFQKRR